MINSIMTYRINLKSVFILLSTFIASLMAQAQVEPEHYYIDVNHSDGMKSAAHNVLDDVLRFKVTEFDHGGDLIYKIYDWRKNVVFNTTKSKQKGANYYEIELSSAFNYDEFYTLDILDNGKSFKVLFKRVEYVALTDPDISITPVDINCSQGVAVVEYSGNFSEGRSPYTAIWRIAEDVTGNTLLGPIQEQQVENAGQLSKISVTTDLSYYVILEIIDACGKTAKQTAFVSCQEDNSDFLLNYEFIQPQESTNGN